MKIIVEKVPKSKVENKIGLSERQMVSKRQTIEVSRSHKNFFGNDTITKSSRNIALQQPLKTT
jgi:hypothetical protein